jgi:hypothetical protein
MTSMSGTGAVSDMTSMSGTGPRRSRAPHVHTGTNGATMPAVRDRSTTRTMPTPVDPRAAEASTAPRSAATSSALRTTTTTPTPTPTSAGTGANATARPSTPIAAPTPTPTPAPPTAPADRLVRENELLRRAVAALAQNQPAAAITALDLHRHDFPDGQLAEDVAALRIQAQCRLGQRDLAARARAALIARWPSSPHLGAIERACGGTLP